MRAADELLKAVVLWAGKDDNIRALVLVGSRARAASVDELADIDLQVYARSREPYTDSDGWLSAIGDLWVCVRDQYPDGALVIPTRLAIFAQGVKVDFAFYPAGAVSCGIGSGLPFQVLLDKDGVIPAPPEASALAGAIAPSEAEFIRTVEEFWFEAYHVAKYLAREDLWLARPRDWAMMQILLRVVEWREAAESATAEVGVDGETSWDTLLETMGRFRQTATETASRFGFQYPAHVDSNLSGFIVRLWRTATAGGNR